MLCLLNKKIRPRLKSRVVYIVRYRQNSCVINAFGVGSIKCNIVYNNLEVIRTRFCALRSAGCYCSCSRYRVTNFYKLLTSIQNVKSPDNNMLGCTTTEQLVKQDIVINEIEFFLRKLTNKILIIFCQQSYATDISCITFNEACVVDQLWTQPNWLLSEYRKNVSEVTSIVLFDDSSHETLLCVFVCF